ncbi:DNA-binding chaperone, putative [Theileria annulata]|uniref:DNA-binding chaperone, putative n=1 Tax=Theileria annulata TaxID=5874 RepID=Q4U9R0_THEAN|nr:DNA-binding chaperone, putative [Theileria annulata]CAI76443.1 DNA-binding chaperone, putative [Theileria annulata]|eukprot:XP_953068.1 DNA-binding chaperone, putative [Theileria annulata]
MRLCNHSHNEGLKISPKSSKGTKTIEPAGFTFFLLKEWKLNINAKQIFEVDNSTKKEDFEFLDLNLEPVRAFSDFCQKYETSSFSYFYKLIWTRIILSDFPSSESESGDEEVSRKRDKKFKSIKTLGFVRNFIAKEKNAYELLNCTDSDETAKIKANYRRLVLLLHPDKGVVQKIPDDLKEYSDKYKVSNISKEEKSELFLLLQDAFTILSDPDMRLEYDSNLPFDEYIPTHEEAKRKDFFLLFGPVFQMNSRWSRVKPVPLLGTNESDDDYVEEFYEFWRCFETLRTFSHAAPHLLEDAESREEKRWMERENLKVQKKLIKKEQLRIQKLIDITQQYDPRLKRRQDRIRNEKLIKQKQAQEAKLLELKRIELEKEQQRLELEKLTEKIKFQKQITKKLRQHMRMIYQKCISLGEIGSTLEKLVTLDYDEMKKFSTQLYDILKLEFDFERCPDNEYLEDLKLLDPKLKELALSNNEEIELSQLFQQISLKINPNQSYNNTTTVEPTVTSTVGQSTGSKSDNMGEWTKEDLKRLSKGVEINPAGTPGRWNLIAKYVKTKTAPQCIEMSKLIANNSDITPYLYNSSNTNDGNTDSGNTNGSNVNGKCVASTSDTGVNNGVNMSGWSESQQTVSYRTNDFMIRRLKLHLRNIPRISTL